MIFSLCEDNPVYNIHKFSVNGVCSGCGSCQQWLAVEDDTQTRSVEKFVDLLSLPKIDNDNRVS